MQGVDEKLKPFFDNHSIHLVTPETIENVPDLLRSEFGRAMHVFSLIYSGSNAMLQLAEEREFSHINPSTVRMLKTILGIDLKPRDYKRGPVNMCQTVIEIKEKLKLADEYAETVVIQGQTIKAQEQDIIEMEQRLSEKDQQLSEKDQVISEKDQQLSEKDLQLSEKDQQLSEKDQQLSEKNQKLSEKDQKIAELQHTIGQILAGQNPLPGLT